MQTEHRRSIGRWRDVVIHAAGFGLLTQCLVGLVLATADPAILWTAWSAGAAVGGLLSIGVVGTSGTA